MKKKRINEEEMITIEGTAGEIQALKEHGFCVMAPELHKTTIDHWEVGDEFKLRYGAIRCCVKVVSKQLEKRLVSKLGQPITPISYHQPVTYLVCAPLPSLPVDSV